MAVSENVIDLALVAGEGDRSVSAACVSTGCGLSRPRGGDRPELKLG